MKPGDGRRVTTACRIKIPQGGGTDLLLLLLQWGRGRFSGGFIQKQKEEKTRENRWGGRARRTKRPISSTAQRLFDRVGLKKPILAAGHPCQTPSSALRDAALLPARHWHAPCTRGHASCTRRGPGHKKSTAGGAKWSYDRPHQWHMVCRALRCKTQKKEKPTDWTQ